ncbi:uncharacterized protein DS421_17g581750 [Arachis hypogaea]|nr:uncharacterized protein DS421_17g581750 [Arachis hypogaea]
MMIHHKHISPIPEYRIPLQHPSRGSSLSFFNFSTMLKASLYLHSISSRHLSL